MFRQICFLSLILISISSAKANLISNGSFEVATINPGGSFIPVFPGEPFITDWDVVVQDVHYMGTFWQSSDGIRNLDLDGVTGSSGGVSQTFSTVAGTQYNVTFDMSGNFFRGPVVKPMRVSADGQSQDFFFDTSTVPGGISVSNMGWTTMSWSFIADDTSATLQFLSLTNTLPNIVPGWGPALDNISVLAANPIPVPAAAWLFGTALIGLVGFSKRRKSA